MTRLADHDFAHRQPGREHPPGDVLPSSEEAVRLSKSSESVIAAFTAEGFGNPPAGIAALVTDYVRRATQDIPLKTIAHMTPGSGNLGLSAATGVNMIMGSLSPMQREVMKAGGNPFNNADMLNLATKLGMGTHAALGGREAAMADGSGRRASSDSYAREIGGNAVYNALLKEGYKASELNAVMPYARELGWTDRHSLRILADTGPIGGEVAKEFEQARKRSDKEGMERARKKAEENEKVATTAREKKGWKGMIQKFDKWNKTRPSARLTTEAENLQAAKSEDGKQTDPAAILAELRKKRLATQPSQKP